jgi:small subunit ribosomal protein S8
MNISDPIADLLTRIRNGSRAEKKFVDVPWSKMKESIVRLLVELGFIERYSVKSENTIGMMRVFLKYSKGRESAIQGLTRVSKPGCRRYIGHDDIPFFYGGMGVSLISTSRGVLTDKEAKKAGVGGEHLLKVW